MALPDHVDLLIVGAGLGGSALAFALREANLDVLILERGPYLKQEPANWDPDAVIRRRKYDPVETWLDKEGRAFVPRTYYNVGGSSKFFGGSAFRLRDEDFHGKSYPEGDTVPWPIDHTAMAPFYDQAEAAMWVHGTAGVDATAAPRGPYPYRALESEPPIIWLEKMLRRQGLSPSPLPIAVHQGPGGRCRKGSPCDGFPCKIRAKGDGENAFLRPALRAQKRISVATGAKVTRLVAEGRRVIAAEVLLDGRPHRVTARTFVLAAGAVNSAAILLRSRSSRHPEGLANSSGVIGRYFMAHNNTVLMALSPLRRNPTRFQKTLTINDFYLANNPWAPFPLGNIQMRGKVLAENLERSAHGLVRLLRGPVARRTFDFWVMSEDLPDRDNRVELLADDEIRLSRTPNNEEPHRVLVERFKRTLRRCGFRFVLERAPGPATIQHQCGTIRFGTDPSSAALDPWCRSFDIENLFVCDGSVFPSSAALNPALTIAANALRVGAYIKKQVGRE